MQDRVLTIYLHDTLLICGAFETVHPDFEDVWHLAGSDAVYGFYFECGYACVEAIQDYFVFVLAWAYGDLLLVFLLVLGVLGRD